MYDLAVIGGGSGGLALSKRAAAVYGKKVLLIEKDAMGGTCVNTGCIPKKMLYNMASLHTEGRSLYGEQKTEYNWKEFREKRDKYIHFLNEMYIKRNEKDEVTTAKGTAVLVKDSITVGEDVYAAKVTVLAMGSRPSTLECTGKENFMTSDDFFKFDEVPASIVIIGTGYIAIETACVLQEFGCEVTLVARRTGVLRAFDEMIQKGVQDSLIRKGIRLIEKSTVTHVEKVSEGVRITLASEGGSEIISAEKVICAIGRHANTEAVLNPEIKKTQDGFIDTDDFFQTTYRNVYAIGDITMDQHMLTPVAIFCGRRLADYLYKNTVKTTLKELVQSVPTVVFSHPPAGSVGYTEEQARNVKDSVSVKEFQLFHPGSLFSSQKNTYKFIVCNETSEICGIHVHGYECDEILQGYSVLVRNNITYPQMSEYFQSIGANPYDILSGVFE
ncbi:glutathione reductase (NADPH) [Nematocida ausubeli]|nr:glutathione reductase (NADPH) [Nematocida ausubeli]